jgi:hypothetical protein
MVCVSLPAQLFLPLITRLLLVSSTRPIKKYGLSLLFPILSDVTTARSLDTGKQRIVTTQSYALCNKEGHQDADCLDPLHCANCSGDHLSFSKGCPELQKQKKTTTVKFQRGIPGRLVKSISTRLQVRGVPLIWHCVTPAVSRYTIACGLLRQRSLPRDPQGCSGEPDQLCLTVETRSGGLEWL